MRRLFKYFSTIFILGLIVVISFWIPVLAASVSVTPSTLKGTVGSWVTVDCSGFVTTPTAEEITLKFQGNGIDTQTVDSSGNCSFGFNVPEKPAGQYEILITRSAAGTSNISKIFTIIPSISPGKTSAVGGSSIPIPISGKGFAANSGIHISFDQIEISTSTVIVSDANGTWTSTFTVPAISSGDHTMAVTDSEATVHEVAINFKTISNAAINVNKTSGATGSSLTVSGSGFVANEGSIVVTIDGNPVGNTATASSSGVWTVTFNVPPIAGGTHTIDAYGSITKSTEITDKTFSVSAGMTISVNSGPPGTQTTITGAGFIANEMGIYVTWDGASIGNSTNAGSNGAWTSTLIVPTTPPYNSSAGPHKINARGTSTSSGGADLTFTVGAGISINKSSGTAGTNIAVSGAGFAAGEKTIVVTFDATTVASNITAGPTGTWTTSFVVPASTGGDHNIGASGATTKASAVPVQAFTTLPSVSLDIPSAPIGSKLTVSGSGFAPGLKDISITYEDQEVATGIKASTAGVWTYSFTVPPSAFGNHTIKITGASVQELNINTLSFKVKPAVAISPDNGTVGTKVVVTGSGFIANSSLQFTFDDNPLNVLPKGTSDNNGNINKTFNIPEKSLSGDHVVRVSDGTNAVELTFTINGNPPPLPKPSGPLDGEQVGFIGSVTPTFTWAKVTASSPVTYTFQLDSNSDFSNPVVEKTGLTINKYTLSKSEALPKGDYYWRVKAVDTASNESPWSQPQYLKSGLMSPVLFYLLLVLVIAVLAVGLYFLFTKVIKKRQTAPTAGSFTSPEIVIPEIINAEYRQLEGDKRALPWRLALPQAPAQPKGTKTLSAEDQVRLKTIIDFAKSLPLPQPDSNTGWLIDMAENNTGLVASPALYSQLLKGEIQVHYEPAWMRHPTFIDLQALLEGQQIMQDLTAYVDAINHSASSAIQVLQDIYHDTSAEITWDFMANDGWTYITAIYADGVAWFQGKNLREPSDRDYSIKTESAADEEPVVMGLYGDQNTSFGGLLVKANGDAEIQPLRALHLKLRRNYRNSERLRDLVGLVTQMEVQRTRLLTAFSQFNRLGT